MQYIYKHNKQLLYMNKTLKKRPTFFSKKFVSKALNIPACKVGQWGIIKSSEGCSPCLLLKNSRNVVDLIKGEFKSCVELSWTKVFAAPAEISQKKGTITFSAQINGEQITVDFKKQDLEEIYSRRFYLPDTDNKIFF